MNKLFLILLSASLVALVVLVTMVIIDMLKKKKSNTLYRSTGIAVLVTFISIMGFVFTIDETEIADQPKEVVTENQEGPKVETPAINMANANDTSIPLNDRIQKIATDLFGATTVQGTERNITVDSMGDAFFLKLMVDDGVTQNNTLEIAQRNTVDILEVLQQVDEWQMITINWQGDFKDSTGNSSVGSALAVGMTKEDLEKVNFEDFKPADLKKVATNYGTHNDFK